MSSEMLSTDDVPVAPLTRTTRLCALLVLLVSLVCSIVWSHYKTFWSDEVLEYLCDAKPSVGAIIYDQAHRAFSLDPPAYHILLHFMLKLAPAHPVLDLRLPSFLSLLVIELCVFRLAYRFTRQQHAALFAMALPILLVTMSYAAEARVYELFTAFFGLALVCYQAAIEPEQSARKLWLAGLFLSLSACILVQYNGIFFPLPVLAGELFRTVRRRKLDWPLLAVTAAYATFALNLPALPSMHEVQAHYYTGQTNLSYGPLSYLFFFIKWHIYSSWVSLHKVWIILGIGASAIGLLTTVSLRRWRRWDEDPRTPALIAVMAAFCLPIVIFLFSRFITHAYSARYGMPAAVAIAVLMGMLFAPWLRPTRNFALAMLLLCVVAGASDTFQIKQDRSVSTQTLQRTLLNGPLQQALAGQPDKHIYMQNNAVFVTTYFYGPPALRARLVDLRSIAREMFWLNHAVSSIFARKIQETTSLPILPYEELEKQPGPHIFIVYHDASEEWIGQEIDSGTVAAVPLGNSMGGEIYRVTFRQTAAGLTHQLDTGR